MYINRLLASNKNLFIYAACYKSFYTCLLLNPFIAHFSKTAKNPFHWPSRFLTPSAICFSVPNSPWLQTKPETEEMKLKICKISILANIFGRQELDLPIIRKARHLMICIVANYWDFWPLVFRKVCICHRWVKLMPLIIDGWLILLQRRIGMLCRYSLRFWIWFAAMIPLEFYLITIWFSR